MIQPRLQRLGSDRGPYSVNSASFQSFLGSLCLHLGLLVVVLFAPSFASVPEPVQDGRIIAGFVTIGKGGVAKRGSAQLSANPVEQVADPALQSRLNPKEDLRTQVESIPKDVVPVADPVNAEVKPEPKPEVKPEPKPEVKPDPKPDAKPEIKPEAKPEIKPDPKPEVKPDPKPDAKPEIKPENKPTTQTKPTTNSKPRVDVNKTVADLAKMTHAQDAAGGEVDNAMAELGAEFGDVGATGDGGLGGGDGIGILGEYEDSVVSRIRPNWSRPERADRKQYTALVNIKIAADGTIRESKIIRSSGDQMFDASVLRAVRATRTLERPPRPDFMDMDIYFNSEMLNAK